MRMKMLTTSIRSAPRIRHRGPAVPHTGNIMWIVSALAFFSPPAGAHLSILRQGYESPGLNEPVDRFGAALAAGDFNGDGIEDLAIGSPQEVVGTLLNAGAVSIHWGTPLGITHEGAVIYTAQDAGGQDQAQMQFGFALAAGDFNGDGRDDLAIGAPGSDLGIPLAGAGQVYVMAGGPNGLSNWLELNQAEAGGAQEVGDRFGTSLAVGNFNGDATPYADLAVGAPGEDSNAGAVSWFTGSLLGLGFTASGTFRPSNLGGANQVGAQFGLALAAGNLLGSSHDDLAIGVPSFDDAQADAGGFWLVRGATGGLATAGAVFFTAWDFDQIQAGARLGSALATGRLFDGLYSSLAIGEPRRDGFGQDYGRVIVARGTVNGLDVANHVILRQESWSGSPEPDDLFGWSLATGAYYESWDYDVLVVGSPGETAASNFANGGRINLFRGTASGPESMSWEPGYDQSNLGDFPNRDNQFGFALACGTLDGTGRANIIIGSPGEESNAGQVHIVAPWRQPPDPEFRHATTYDCEGSLVYSLKPFDQVYIASTTKVMTVLLACERSQLPPSHPNFLDFNAQYTVPAWVANDIPGSQVPLVRGERLTVGDLAFTCLLLSGNDAANAIAHAIYGGNENTCLPAFVAEMNARAAQLGMTGTHFHNPAGLDNEPVGPELGEHYSTPVDMAKLARAAMQNPLFAEIAGTLTYSTTRRFPDGLGGFTATPWQCQSFFTGVIQNGIQPATGIKGGRTPKAQVTGLFSADADQGGTVIATTFLTNPDNGSRYVPDAANLLSIALEECSTPLVFNPQYLPFRFNLPGLSTFTGDISGGATTLDVFGLRNLDMSFELFRTQGAGPTAARPELQRITQITFEPGETVPFGIAPFDGHRPLVLTNLGDIDAELRVTRSYLPGVALDLTIPPGGQATIPAFDSPSLLSNIAIQIENLTQFGRLRADLSVEERYFFDLPQIPAGDGSVFQARIERNGGILDDSIEILLFGLDPNPGSRLFAAVYDADSFADVPIGEAGRFAPDTAAPVVRGLSASPNPFAARTELSFELLRPARAELRIFDVTGREVHASRPSALRPGRWSVAWDGQRGDASTAPPGIYFYRLYLDGVESGGGKLVRVR